MRITVCELPHDPLTLALAWTALCAHTTRERPEILLLPEFAFVAPVWEAEQPDPLLWSQGVAQTEQWLRRLPESNVPFVVGARPVLVEGVPYNEGFLWSAAGGAARLRRKFFLPDEPGGRESRWFRPGDRAFPAFDVAGLSFGLNICTELWELDTYAAYAAKGVAAVFSPRATAAATTSKWLAIGTVAAVRTGAYSLSSNRVHPDGSCGGVGWVIDPDGQLLARTSASEPFCTVDIDLETSAAAQRTYPRYVFRANRNGNASSEG